MLPAGARQPQRLRPHRLQSLYRAGCPSRIRRGRGYRSEGPEDPPGERRHRYSLAPAASAGGRVRRYGRQHRHSLRAARSCTASWSSSSGPLSSTLPTTCIWSRRRGNSKHALLRHVTDRAGDDRNQANLQGFMQVSACRRFATYGKLMVAGAPQKSWNFEVVEWGGVHPIVSG